MTLTPNHPLLSFYLLCEKLKLTMRHSWLSDGKRQESVAEHSWIMALLAMAVLPQLQKKLDSEKILKMIILHDLAEAITTDMPVWEGVQNKEAKFEAEKVAIEKLFAPLPENVRKEFLKLWQEYEDRNSLEAKFVKAIDTLDVITQHNAAPTETWDDNDYMWQLSPLQDKFFDFDEILREVKNTLDDWSIQKATNANNIEKLDQAELKKRQSK